MTKDISKLPKWAQEHISSLESELKKSKSRERALHTLLSDPPEIEPDVLPPSKGLVNGWIARRPVSSYERPKTVKACSGCVSHSTRGWDRTDSQGKLAMYSSPDLALKALIPSIVKAYRDELAYTIDLIEKEEKALSN